MKTILEINTTNYSSTGNIMLNIAKEARKSGYQVYTCCKNSKSSQQFSFDNHFLIGYRFDWVISNILSYISGLRGYFNVINTIWLIRKINKIHPDIIHLHALGETYLNIPLFFSYLKKKNKPIIWTLHDGWPITGGCAFFALANCYKWKNKCNNCPLRKFEKISLLLDTSSFLQKSKKKYLTGFYYMTIITPSKWLASNIKESFLKQYQIDVINNGINLTIYKPTNSNFILDKHLEGKYIVLGVAFMWNDRKGIKDFIKLSEMLPSNYSIVMVGHVENSIKLPENIIHINKTHNKGELVSIYSCANVFVNTTYEDNFPTVNIEALACGTPVLTYNTGGSPEAVDTTCGSVVQKGDINSLIKEIKRICEEKPYSKENCVARAKQFDMNRKFNDYVDLYNKLTNY